MSELDLRLKYQAEVLKDIHSCFNPHIGQKMICNALFYQGKKQIFVECGRKFGKTECIPYIAYRQALSFPNQVIYIIGPFLKQMKEIIWADGRITRFLGKLSDKYIRDINKTELRVTFKNDSFIKLDGADNFEAFRGPNPHMMLYDEFKDHHPKFHEGNEPNLAPHKAPLIVFGTPPDTFDNLFCKLADETKISPKGSYFNMPTHINPHIDREWLDEMKAKLIARGEWDVWQREYMARRVVGGSNAIFPMFKRSKHVRPHNELLTSVKAQYKKYDYFCSFDPGTSSCFAALFVAIDRRTKEIVILDEIYEKNRLKTTTQQIFPIALEKIAQIHDYFDHWRLCYDHAAAWFENEVNSIYDIAIEPCEKDLKNKDKKISMIKDIMLSNCLSVSDKCTNFVSEVENYCTNKHGKIPKENDHLIDNLRYALNLAGYDFNSRMDLEQEPDPRRFYVPTSDDIDTTQDYGDNSLVINEDRDSDFLYEGGYDDY